MKAVGPTLTDPWFQSEALPSTYPLPVMRNECVFRTSQALFSPSFPSLVHLPSPYTALSTLAVKIGAPSPNRLLMAFHASTMTV